MKKRIGTAALIRQRVKNGHGGRPTLDWIAIVLKDPCPYCGEYGCDSLDHITPVVRRSDLNTGFGMYHWTNLVACHRRCNMEKGRNGVIHKQLEFIPEYLRDRTPGNQGPSPE